VLTSLTICTLREALPGSGLEGRSFLYAHLNSMTEFCYRDFVQESEFYCYGAGGMTTFFLPAFPLHCYLEYVKGRQAEASLFEMESLRAPRSYVTRLFNASLPPLQGI